MDFAFLDSWRDFLPRDAGHVIGVCGSGGKTSLLRDVGEALAEAGRPVALTTTTRSEPLPGVPDTVWEPSLRAADLPLLVYVHGGVDGAGKWRGLPVETVDAAAVWAPDHTVVVEVDGAAKHPLKQYRAGEPVWPRRTSLALVVVGVWAVGEKAGGGVHRLGREGVTPVQDWNAETLVSWDHVFDLLTLPGGYLDQLPPDVPAVLVLNGLDDQPDSIGLFEFAGRVMDLPRVPLIVFAGREGDGRTLRAACRIEGDDGHDA